MSSLTKFECHVMFERPYVVWKLGMLREDAIAYVGRFAEMVCAELYRLNDKAVSGDWFSKAAEAVSICLLALAILGYCVPEMPLHPDEEPYLQLMVIRGWCCYVLEGN